jgi:hypothetical protein
MTDSIDNYFLPLDTEKKVVIATFILEGDESDEQVKLMVKIICRGLYQSGWYQDADNFGYQFTDLTLTIYKKVPIFDVWNHLHTC